jgi:hypothetical protein
METWGVALVIAVFGDSGSLVYRLCSEVLNEKWWQSLLTGVVAAIGVGAFTLPASGLQLVGTSALAGFFARSLLAALESRIQLELTLQQADRAMNLASDAIELSRRSRTSTAAPPSEVDLKQLSARLDDMRPIKQAAP